jgi:hypothetical protein
MLAPKLMSAPIRQMQYKGSTSPGVGRIVRLTIPSPCRASQSNDQFDFNIPSGPDSMSVCHNKPYTRTEYTHEVHVQSTE